MHHHHAHNDKGRSRCSTGNGQEQRAEEQGQGEAASGGEGRETGTAAFTHTGSALHVRGGGGSTQAGTAHRADGVGQEHLLHAGNVVPAVAFRHQTGTLMHTDDGAHGVEHVNEQEGENNHQHIQGEDIVPFELEGDGLHAVRKGDNAIELGNGLPRCRILDHQAQQRGGQNAPKHAATDLGHHQTGGDEQADEAQQGLAFGDVPQGHQRCVVIHYNPGILQADERNEQTDAGADGLLQGTRDGVDEPGTHLGERQDNEQDTFNEHGRKGKLPGIAHT